MSHSTLFYKLNLACMKYATACEDEVRAVSRKDPDGMVDAMRRGAAAFEEFQALAAQACDVDLASVDAQIAEVA